MREKWGTRWRIEKLINQLLKPLPILFLLLIYPLVIYGLVQITDKSVHQNRDNKRIPEACYCNPLPKVSLSLVKTYSYIWFQHGLFFPQWHFLGSAGWLIVYLYSCLLCFSFNPPPQHPMGFSTVIESLGILCYFAPPTPIFIF